MFSFSLIRFYYISYEIQLIESARSQGLGEFFMSLLDKIGSYWKMDKVMLTVFKGKRWEMQLY